MIINEQQKEILLNYFDTFSKSLMVINQGKEENYKTFDEKRAEAIPTLLELMNDYVNNKINIEDFKEKNEMLCRKLPFWGFKNFSGQCEPIAVFNQFTAG